MNILPSLLKVIPLSGEMSRSDKRVMGPLAVGGLNPSVKVCALTPPFNKGVK